jgi:hypothetical protein
MGGRTVPGRTLRGRAVASAWGKFIRPSWGVFRFFRILGAGKYLIHWLPQNLQQHQSPPRGSQTRVSARMAICTENAEEPNFTPTFP